MKEISRVEGGYNLAGWYISDADADRIVDFILTTQQAEHIEVNGYNGDKECLK